MNNIKVKSIITTSCNSFGDKITAFYATDGSVRYLSMNEGEHFNLKPNQIVYNSVEVKPVNGIINLTFLFN